MIKYLPLKWTRGIHTGAKLNPLGGSNFGRFELILSFSFGGSSGITAESSTPSGSSSSYAAVKRFLVRVGPTVRARFGRRWVGFRPVKPNEGTDVRGGGAETLRAKVAGER